MKEAAEDDRVPAAIRNLPVECVLMLPLIAQAGDDSKFLGCMCLARKEQPVFSPDEIVRLSTIAEHMASLIDSDRRRKLAIAMTERERLMRDLHDSVSQKLYGLVTTTEAAQAALEAGSSVDPAQEFAAHRRERAAGRQGDASVPVSDAADRRGEGRTGLGSASSSLGSRGPGGHQGAAADGGRGDLRFPQRKR